MICTVPRGQYSPATRSDTLWVVSTPSSDKVKASHLPLALTGMQVDITTRMGALAPATTTGFGQLDALLAGGLRTGTVISVTGVPGCGKTAFALLMAYMAARSRAAVIFCSPILDETEVMARLAARAMYREYPDAETPYAAIWSGEAWQDDFTRQAVSTSVNVAVRKVGSLLHLFRVRPLESATELANAAAYLFARHERVVIVIDGFEAFFAAAGGDAVRAAGVNADYSNRLSQVAYELKQMADSGCAVVVTTQAQTRQYLSPVSTADFELALVDSTDMEFSRREVGLGTRMVNLQVTKNRVGPLALVPLRFVAGSSVFESPAEDIEG
jgi:KaiC/GvpD/RAD55 family RecA-like ATPase